jgi:PAS domain S-box-containing protein
MTDTRGGTSMVSNNDHPSLTTTLGIVFVAMLVAMFIYEMAKQLLNPSITIWESHTITILFTSIVSVVVLFFPLRSLYREQEKTKDALVRQQEAEERLRQSEARYRSFVESAEDSIYTVDIDLRYLLINTQHLERRGLLPEMYAGKTYGDFHSQEETAIFESRVRQVTETKTSAQDGYEHEGNYYHRTFNPVIDPRDNTVIAVTVISSDITDRKRAERNIEITNKKLSLMNDITRHDILNQLTTLNSILTLADEQTQDRAVKKYLIRSEQVSETIQSQILFARDYQDIGIESPRWQNIHTTIQHARQSLKIQQLTVDEGCHSLEIYADPLLEKVFYNLLDNAQRYAGPFPEVQFRCHQDQDVLIIICEDNGPGIPDGEKELLFTRGFGKNTGLGLFLIREILAITGISIRETGEPGHGSRFEIIVPERAFRPAAHACPARVH